MNRPDFVDAVFSGSGIGVSTEAMKYLGHFTQRAPHIAGGYFRSFAGQLVETTDGLLEAREGLLVTPKPF